MRRFVHISLLTILALVFTHGLCIAQTKRTIHVATAGTLSSYISEEEKYQIEELTLTGEINGSDLGLLREMAGQSKNLYLGGHDTEGKLTVLNLSETRIRAGGERYAEIYGSMEDDEFYVNSDDIIPQRVFSECRNLISIIIPQNIKSIGYFAFSGCSSLLAINIPNNVTSIGDGAFYGCTELTTITIPNSVTSIGDNAFYNCYRLSSISIPNSVTTIGSGAFASTAWYENQPDGLVYIGKIAYVYKGEMPANTKFTIKDGTESISKNAFSDCKNLTSIVIPNSVTTIGNGAFSGTAWYENQPDGLVYAGKVAYKYKGEMPANTSITITDGTLSISDEAFRFCKMTSIFIPNSVRYIGSYTFFYCDKLTSITIPNSVTSIGDKAFDSCSGLTSITIPNSVTSIGRAAFSGCRGLTSITIPNSVISIGDESYAGCSRLSSITIPNSVKSIGESAFSGCESLTSITIPNSVNTIGSNAFSSCSNLTSITIPNSVTSIGSSAFWICSGLTSITIPNSVTSISNRAFFGCSGLTSITIPNSVTSIGYAAFEDCSGLTSITIPNSVASIGSYAFYGCSGLTSIVSEIKNPFAINESVFYSYDKDIYGTATLTVPAGTKSLYQSTDGWKNFKNIVEASGGSSEEVRKFESGGITYNVNDNGTTVTVTAGNTKYKGSISIPSSVSYNGKTFDVTSIGYAAFGDCTGLTSISIPNSVMYIQYGAFQNCSGLSSITLPNSIRSIAQYAFIGCSSLTKIVSEIESPFSLEGSTFDNSTFSNATLTVPAGTKSLYQSTGGWKNFKNIVEAGRSEVQTKRTIHVSSAGTLSNCITESEKYQIEELALTGYLNGTDIKYIQEMAGDSVVIVNWHEPITHTSTNGKLKKLDMSKANIVQGGDGCVFIYDSSDEDVLSFNTLDNSISYLLFAYTFLEDIILPSSVTSIEPRAFNKSFLSSIRIGDDNTVYDSRDNCIAIIESNTNQLVVGCKNTIIPNSVTSIGYSAFEGCSGLTSITIPNKMTSIGEYAFYGCSGLTSIISEIQNPFAIYCFDNNIYSNAELTVPAGTKAKYQATDGWKNFKNIVEAGGEDEPEFTVEGITYRRNVSTRNAMVKSADTSRNYLEIPESVSYGGTSYQVTGIDDNAFRGCNLAALVWDAEAMLPDNAFNGATLSSNFLLYVESVSYAPPSIKNVVAHGAISSLTLSDEGAQFYCPRAFTAENISYTHNYNMETGGDGKGWETIALPFNVQTIKHRINGEIVPFACYNQNSNKKPFWLYSFSGSGFVRASSIQANTPYIIAMPNQSSYSSSYVLAGDVTFSAENVDIPATPSFSGKFVPAYSTVKKASNVYAINAVNRYVSETGGYDAGSRFISNLRDVRPFEAYMSDSSTRGIIEIGFGDGTTGMDKIFVFADSEREIGIYTLNGQKVMQTKQSELDNVMNQLPHGVYIVNGKKIVK